MSAPRASSGFSLTEMLVASTLLSVATASGVTALAQSRQSQRAVAERQQLHERAQYVFASLEPELLMAGYFAGPAPARLPEGSWPEGAGRCGPWLVQRLDRAIEVLPDWSLDCEARNGGAAAGSEVLVTRRISGRLAAAPEAGRAQWLSHPLAAATLHWHGDAGWSARDALPGHELRELLVNTWYIAREADGDPSVAALRVKSLTSIAGNPAFIDTEVMAGVESLHVELLPSPADPQVARLRLRLRNGAGGLRGEAGEALDVTRTFRLRNAAAEG